MPNFQVKKVAFLSLFLALFGQLAHAQASFFSLKQADSLFEAGQPDSAYQHYKKVLHRQRQVSPRMLLRLAAFQESRSNYAVALYYLSVYQAHYPSRVVWQKMVDIARVHRIAGYPDTWRQSLALTFRRYYPSVLQAMLAVAVAAGMLLLLRRRGTGQGWWLTYGMYLILVLAFLHLFQARPTGLVCQPRAMLMAAPSAASEWLTTAAAGDRMIIQGRDDIWYRVQWRGRAAYIRQHDLLLVE